MLLLHAGNATTLNTNSTSTSVNFAFAPGVGYHLANFDFGIRYQSISSSGGSTNSIGIRAAYVFGDK